MRLFFFLLVFANLIFFAWTQGHFGPTDGNREPQRMSQQLHAEKLAIVSSAPLSPANRDDVVCRAIDGLGTAEAEALKAAAAGMEVRVLPLTEPKIYLVAITDLASKTAADRKTAELARFGVTELKTVALPDGRREIVLGSFPAEAAANEFLLGLAKRGVKSARVESREPPVLKARAEVRAPSSILLRQLPQMIAPYAEATVGDCTP